MNKEKQMQVPEKLIIEVYKLILSLEPEYMSKDQQELMESIETQITGKMERMKARKLYTDSKTLTDAEEKEKARIEYLDLKGIPSSFRH